MKILLEVIQSQIQQVLVTKMRLRSKVTMIQTTQEMMTLTYSCNGFSSEWATTENNKSCEINSIGDAGNIFKAKLK